MLHLSQKCFCKCYPSPWGSHQAEADPIAHDSEVLQQVWDGHFEVWGHDIKEEELHAVHQAVEVGLGMVAREGTRLLIAHHGDDHAGEQDVQEGEVGEEAAHCTGEFGEEDPEILALG